MVRREASRASATRVTSLARASRSPEMLRRSDSSCSNLSKRAQPFSVFSRQVLVSIATGRLGRRYGATTTVVWPRVMISHAGSSSGTP